MSLSFLHSRYPLAAVMSAENKEADGPRKEEEEAEKGDTDANLDGNWIVAVTSLTALASAEWVDAALDGSSLKQK